MWAADATIFDRRRTLERWMKDWDTPTVRRQNLSPEQLAVLIPGLNRSQKKGNGQKAVKAALKEKGYYASV